MPFNEIAMAYKTVRTPASIRLRDRADGATTITLGFSIDFLADFPLAAKQRFKALFGDGADAGKLRLVRDARGSIMVRLPSKGGASFSFSVRKELTDVPQAKRPCDATVLDRDTIEITLPEWDAAESLQIADRDRQVLFTIGKSRMKTLRDMACEASCDNLDEFAGRLLCDVLDDTAASERDAA